MRSKIVGEYSYLLNEAQELINNELKAKFKQGEISPVYGENGSWLDVIQIFNYSLECWEDHTVLAKANELLLLIKIHELKPVVVKPALKLICSFILVTETLYYWYGERRLHLFNRLQTYFPLKGKELNYDYLRYVYNSDIGSTDKEVIIS